MAKILLIEDNFKNRYLLSFMLEKAGHEVIQVDNGREGLSLLQAGQPDLILLDIQLPDMDGFAVLTAIGEDDALRQIKIVAVTSYAMPGDRERILAAGCLDCIEKPIDPDTFMSRVSMYLNEGNAG